MVVPSGHGGGKLENYGKGVMNLVSVWNEYKVILLNPISAQIIPYTNCTGYLHL